MFHIPRFFLQKILLLILSSLFVSAAAYEISEKEIHDARQLNRYLVNCEFSRARGFCDSLFAEEEVRRLPLYYYMKVAAMGLESLDRDQVVHRESFYNTYNSGMAVIDSLKTAGERSSDLVMTEGFLTASFFSYLLLDGKYMTAIKYGRGALDTIETAKKLDSSNYDADYYIGFYSLAKGELKNRLRMFLFWMPDGIKNGAESLENCMDSSRFMSSAAAMVLVDVYVRDGSVQKAAPMLDSLQGEFPHSRFLRWTEARLKEQQKDDAGAGQVYENLCRSYLDADYIHNALVTGELARTRYTTAGAEATALQKEIRQRVERSSLNRDDEKLYDAIVGR
ncbi:MAG: hypothetical protein ACQEQV_11265 [Fibrobacterota bacterium]